jgi:hypothetical protein
MTASTLPLELRRLALTIKFELSVRHDQISNGLGLKKAVPMRSRSWRRL